MAEALATSIQYRVLAMAKTQLGQHEDSRGYSKFGLWYGKQPQVKDSGFYAAPWCDMFAAWAMWMVGGNVLLNIAGDYALTTAHAEFLRRKGVTNRTPAEGSLVFQNWDLNGTGNANISEIDHVEFCVKDYKDGTIGVIGGNVGNAVKEVRRNLKYAVVFGHWWKLVPPEPVLRKDEDYFIDA